MSQAAFWPSKGGASSNGQSSCAGPFHLFSQPPSWSFREPTTWYESKPIADVFPFKWMTFRCFHSSPVIDSDYNVYMVSTQGCLFALSKSGQLRWTYKTGGWNLSNPAIYEGALYFASGDGVAYALEAVSGKEKWRIKIGAACPLDVASVVAKDGVILLPATPEDWSPGSTEQTEVLQELRTKRQDRTQGNEEVVALTSDGTIKWRYSMAADVNRISYNMLPCFLQDGNVVIHDITGGVCKLSMESGKKLWYEAGVVPSSWSTGGVTAGPNDVAYCGFAMKNPYFGQGMVRAHCGQTGAVLWSRSFDQGVNAAPAVGQVGCTNRVLAVVVPVGHNPVLPDMPGVATARMLGFSKAPAFQGRIETLHADTGEVLWIFKTPILHGTATLRSSFFDLMLPDHWGSPAIGADGTVYANWSGGKAYALRDVNEDGVVDAESPEEVSSFHHGYGSNGCTAIAPGIIAVPDCKHIHVWTWDVPQEESLHHQK